MVLPNYAIAAATDGALDVADRLLGIAVGFLGNALGFDVWVASNDRSRAYGTGRLADGCRAELPAVFTSSSAAETIRLIDKGGPFPYSRDGIEFQNRERILPRKQRGYYSEYTVITPGSNDRGARRIIAGENGELYYTDDHYDSFKEVVR